MAWFRRRRPDPDTDTATSRADEPGTGAPTGPSGTPSGGPEASAASGGDLVPLAPGQSLARTERALELLAAQSAQLHGHLVRLEERVDRLSDALLDRLDVPTHDDVLQARMHSARVAAELSRLEINLAARLDAVRDQLRGSHEAAAEIDLRVLTPNDTGWTPAR